MATGFSQVGARRARILFLSLGNGNLGIATAEIGVSIAISAQLRWGAHAWGGGGFLTWGLDTGHHTHSIASYGTASWSSFAAS